MICGTYTRTNVSPDDVDLVVRAYKANIPPPTSVTATKDSNGKTYTVVATWPPCTGDTTHSPAGAHGA
jgi:hypothetical protein